jgi:hypothetical protein
VIWLGLRQIAELRSSQDTLQLKKTCKKGSQRESKIDHFFQVFETDAPLCTVPTEFFLHSATTANNVYMQHVLMLMDKRHRSQNKLHKNSTTRQLSNYVHQMILNGILLGQFHIIISHHTTRADETTLDNLQAELNTRCSGYRQILYYSTPPRGMATKILPLNCQIFSVA